VRYYWYRLQVYFTCRFTNIVLLYEWRTKILTKDMARWRFVLSNAMCKNRISVSGWSPIGCEGVHANLNIPSPHPTTLVFRSFGRLLMLVFPGTVVNPLKFMIFRRGCLQIWKSISSKHPPCEKKRTQSVRLRAIMSCWTNAAWLLRRIRCQSCWQTHSTELPCMPQAEAGEAARVKNCDWDGYYIVGFSQMA
jgi:hypothetical protein